LSHETHVPAVQDPPRAQSRVPRPHEHRGRTQGALLTPAEGSGPAHAGLIGPRPADPGLTPRIAGNRSRGRAYRLRGARAFEAIFRSGARFDGRYLQLVAAPAAQQPGRVGFIIPRRALPLAVDRNRLRRRLREALRLARPAVERFDVIVRVRQPVPRDAIRAAVDEAAALLSQLVAS
jgi:ribonuclease P protein component